MNQKDKWEEEGELEGSIRTQFDHKITTTNRKMLCARVFSVLVGTSVEVAPDKFKVLVNTTVNAGINFTSNSVKMLMMNISGEGGNGFVVEVTRSLAPIGADQ